MKKILIILSLGWLITACNNRTDQNQDNAMNKETPIQFMILAPGHFHAGLVLKNMYGSVDSTVYVYAPEGPEIDDFLARIRQYNTREENPTAWQLEIYRGPEYLEQLIQNKPGNVMITAGNNKRKTEYIKASVDAGIHVLADKPMAIDVADFELLKQAFASAEQNDVLLYDIMTERYEITTMMQKAFSQIPEIFGQLEQGSPDNPAVTKESVHHFFKYVSGKPLVRPAWFMDVSQQGEGIVDVTTHLVDLIQWECFPEEVIDYQNEINITSARRWPTKVTPAEFENITGQTTYPEYLLKDVVQDSILNVYANGEINYQIKGVHAKVSVIWNYQAPEGAGDTHFSIMRGSKANLVIRQGEAQNFQPELYIEPVGDTSMEALQEAVENTIGQIQQQYEGVTYEPEAESLHVIIPNRYRVGHEAHFSQVTEKYLEFMEQGQMPDWEVPNMLAKYYTTTKALEVAQEITQ
ncbi:MAG: putative oxidoreductase C-terminal domain-containing protein [Candidatus Cyclobacteriaceae bacterium M3_2C_046]